ncbi:hypothetical protein LINPERHAP1_LOCUS10575 [Linum perenne]
MKQNPPCHTYIFLCSGMVEGIKILNGRAWDSIEKRLSDKYR